MSERIPTGIIGLDAMIQNGVKRGSHNLIVGPPGTGKSTIATQFLVGGIKNNEAGLYLSLEEKKEKFMENMGQYGFKLDEYEKKGLFKFQEISPSQFTKNINDGILSIDNYVQEMKAKRLVLDSLTAYLMVFDTEKDRKTELMQLFDRLDKWGVTTMLISEAHQEEAKFGVSYYSDSIINVDLKIDKEKNSR
ncbi:MAG: AAA family ATPase, partial [Candidatus Altiarchaeota archaeon]|nr:AAA family ATPase [Candidatus Altiarchaeota archaeon]